MSFLKFFSPFIAAIFVLAGMTGCVKDVDFDQADEVLLGPELQVDLVFFNVEKEDLFNAETGEVRQIFRDTVRLEFLNDDFIQDDLQELELSFRYLNSFPEPFRSRVKFLSGNNQNQYELLFDIAPGAAGNPSRTEIVEHFGPGEFEFLKRSIKIVVEFEVEKEPTEGKLNFGAKGLFIFEF